MVWPYLTTIETKSFDGAKSKPRVVIQNLSQGSGREETAHSNDSKRRFNDWTVCRGACRIKGTNRLPPNRILPLARPIGSLRG